VFGTVGGEYYKVRINKQVRVGGRGRLAKTFLIGTLKSQKDGVCVILRVGRHSGLIGSGGPLATDSHPDSGRIILRSRSDIPGNISWLDRDRGQVYPCSLVGKSGVAKAPCCITGC
jgi:hypothetical protein